MKLMKKLNFNDRINKLKEEKDLITKNGCSTRRKDCVTKDNR